MREIDQEVDYVRFEHVAPDEIWAEIASLFVLSFAALLTMNHQTNYKALINGAPANLLVLADDLSRLDTMDTWSALHCLRGLTRTAPGCDD